MRHGHSQANEEGIIVSDPSVGTERYGLTSMGRSQVENAAASFAGDPSVMIYSSDFKRARETSEILSKIWKSPEITYTQKLRERFFGDFDGSDQSNYLRVWEKDKKRGDYEDLSIESPKGVASRLQSLLSEIEREHSDKTIFLISHGDCLQILQAMRMRLSPAEHRTVPHLDVAEIRAME